MRPLVVLLLCLAMMNPVAAADRRVKTMLYYGLNGINTAIPASFMAAHTEFVDSDIGESDRAEAFKHAGGRYAMAYTDPGTVPYCSPPFGPGGRCTGSIGNLNPPESAWLHDSHGERIRRFVNDHFQYTEALNPASPAAQAAYHAFTEKLLGTAPDVDFFLADDSGGPLRGYGDSLDSGAYWNFNERPVELRDDQKFVAGREAMFRSAARPVIVNGVGPDDMPSYDGAFGRAPNVAGILFEGCIQDSDTGLHGIAHDKLRRQSDGLLATIAANRYAVCMFVGKATPANRIYDLASWWLTYDPRYSVAAPNVDSSDGFTVFPEFAIVPTQPRETAHKTIADLRTPAGLYLRRFGACFQNGAPIGPCAAVVNPTGDAQPFPAGLGGDRRSLILEDRSEYTGGRATWQHGAPRGLGALSAAIVSG